MVTVDTKLISLLGYPLRQTFAPQMFNRTFSELGMDFFYFPIEVESDRLGTIVSAIRCMNYAGFNVTKPNKTAILEHLDELDNLARAIGSVNVVAIREGVLKGYNTDGVGFVDALLERTTVDLAQSDFLILGAGGASRAISTTLASRGARKLYIVDQFDSASSEVVNNVNSMVRECAEFVPFADAPMAELVAGVDVLVNATGIGMYPNADRTPLERSLLRPGLLVVDITYNPAKTRLLLDAEAAGCTIMNGLGMAIHQGIAGFTLMTGRPGPPDVMTRVMHEIAAQN